MKDYAIPSTQKKDFFPKMAPRPSFWKSTQFSSAGTCIEKVHLNAKPQNFFWNKNQSLVILQIYICFAFKKSHQKKFYALMPVRKLLVWLSATYSKVAFALKHLFCSVFCASIEEFEFPYHWLVLFKGCLISEHSSLWLKSQKKWQNHYPEHLFFLSG